MLKHGRAGVPMEVMGLMLGSFVDEYTVQVWTYSGNLAPDYSNRVSGGRRLRNASIWYHCVRRIRGPCLSNEDG